MQQVVIYRIQAANLHKFNGMSAFILPQSENISVTNGHVVTPFCMFGLIEKEYLDCETELRNKTEEVEKLKVEMKDLKEILKLKDDFKENGLEESVI